MKYMCFYTSMVAELSVVKVVASTVAGALPRSIGPASRYAAGVLARAGRLVHCAAILNAFEDGGARRQALEGG